MYTTIKIIHISCVLLSFVGFFSRGILMARGSSLLQAKLTKIAPHVIDTILLVSAVYLVISSSQYPALFNWLTLKIIGLILYIFLGLVAFRFAKTMPLKITAWLGAMLIFIGIAFIAVTKPV